MANTSTSRGTEFVVSNITSKLVNGVATLVLLLVSLGLLIFVMRVELSMESLIRDAILFLILLLPWIAVHEAIHVTAGVLAGGYSLSDVQFGFNRRIWAPCISILVPVTVKTYRTILIAPFLLSVPISIVLFLHLPGLFSTFFGALIVATCSTDLLVLYAVRTIPSSSMVMDHPDSPGVIVCGDAVPVGQQGD